MNHTFRIFALGLVGLGAAGCTMPFANSEAQAFSAEQAYPITVEPQVATLVVKVDDGLQKLARGEGQRVRAFAERWKIKGQGMLNAATPTGAPNQAAAVIALEELKTVLAESGIDKNSVQFTSYRAASTDTQAPITLSFVTYAANAADCGTDWSANLAYTPRNVPWPEFGCSTQHNFAAMISDPHDLIEPRASDPIDAGRRSTVLEKYGAGQPTSTPSQNNADSGRVSNVAR